MIHKVLLQGFGLYEMWASPDFARMTDIVGQNGVGKSTLLDAINVGLGLNQKHHLFDGKRSTSDYQRIDVDAAYVILQIENPVLPSGKRRISGSPADVTLMCRMQASKSPVCMYQYFDGWLSLEDAITQSSRRSWLNTSAYHNWLARYKLNPSGLKQRIFRVSDTDSISRLKGTELNRWFREQTSDAENVDRQNACRLSIAKIQSDIDATQDAINLQTRDRDALDTALGTATTLKAKFERLRRQRLLFRVAKYVEAKREYDRLVAKNADNEDELKRLENQRASLSAELVDLNSARRVLDIEMTGRSKSLANLDERLTNMKPEFMQAAVTLADIERMRRELADLDGTRLPPVVAAEQKSTLEDSRIADRELANLDHRVQTLESRHLDMTKGAPAEVIDCWQALKEAEISFTKVSDFLPADQPQGFEEYASRARFGLLVAPTDTKKAFKILKDHLYPGPLSTLSPDAFQAALNEPLQAGSESFATVLGQYAVTHETPILNPALVSLNLKAIAKELAEARKALLVAKKRATDLDAKRTELAAELARGQRLMVLVDAQRKWADLEDEARQTQRAYNTLESQRTLVQKDFFRTEADFNANKTRIDRAKEALRVVDDSARKLTPDNLMQLREELQILAEDCQGHVEALQHEIDRASVHGEIIKHLEEKTAKHHEPTQDELDAQALAIKNLEISLRDSNERLQSSIEELARDKAKLERVIGERNQHEEDQFKKVRKRIKSLAVKVGMLDANLVRTFNGEDFELTYQVSYRADETTGEPKLEDIRLSADSTGETAKACLVFLMSLTDPNDRLFYIFDEPAKSFSEDAVEDMFKIFNQTGSQVIITTARFTDYGDDVDILQMWLTAEPKSAKNRKALGASIARVNNRTEQVVSA